MCKYADAYGQAERMVQICKNRVGIVSEIGKSLLPKVIITATLLRARHNS